MNLHRIYIVTAVVVFLILNISPSNGACPEPSSLPDLCGCGHYRYRFLICENITETTELKAMFDQVNEAVGSDSTFDFLELWYAEADPPFVVSIPANAMSGGLKFNDILISFGHNVVESIDSDAFPSTSDYTTELSFRDAIFNEDSNLFAFFRSFENLIDARLYYVTVSKIPDFAFDGLRYLANIYVTDSNVEEIGVMPFSFPPALSTLSLTKNMLTVEGLSTQAFEGLSPYAEVSLDENYNLTHLPENIFKTLLDTTESVVQVGFFSGPDDRHLACDERADWICANKPRYYSRLEGYYCAAGEVYYNHIWDYCSSTVKVNSDCPAADSLPAECSCAEGRQLNCLANATTDLKVVFEQVAESAGNNLVFESLDLTYPASQFGIIIPDGATGGLQFKNISLRLSGNGFRIGRDPFPGSVEYTTKLQFFDGLHNSITNLFGMIRKFVNLEYFGNSGGNLYKIDNLAFDGLQFLETISITGSDLGLIDVMPFANLSSLKLLDLSYNTLTTNGFSAGTFDGLNPNAEVNLAGSENFDEMLEHIFKKLLDTTVSTVRVGFEENTDSRYELRCNSRADWICRKADEYQSKLKGFWCTGGVYIDVFHYCS